MPDRSMSDRFTCRRLAWVALGLSLSTPALAHKLRVFAAAEGDLITGSAYFVGGGAASGAHIRVQDAQGRTLAELTPDAEGRFSYRARSAEDLVVVAETGDGHRTEWRVPGAELAGAFAAGGATPAQTPARRDAPARRGRDPATPGDRPCRRHPAGRPWTMRRDRARGRPAGAPTARGTHRVSGPGAAAGHPGRHRLYRRADRSGPVVAQSPLALATVTAGPFPAADGAGRGRLAGGP